MKTVLRGSGPCPGCCLYSLSAMNQGRTCTCSIRIQRVFGSVVNGAIYSAKSCPHMPAQPNTHLLVLEGSTREENKKLPILLKTGLEEPVYCNFLSEQQEGITCSVGVTTLSDAEW